MIRKVSYLRHPRVFALKSLARISRELERPGSWLEWKSLNLASREPLTFADRMVVREYLSAVISERDIVFYDIGANTGQHALALSKLSNVTSVVAFEPAPAAFQNLQANADGHSSVRCVNVALGDRNDKVEFQLNEFTPSSSMRPMLDRHTKEFPYTSRTERITVSMARLDDLVADLDLPTPTIAKLDVQGFEDQVVTGGTRTLSRARWLNVELSLVPLYEGAPLFDEMYRLISDLGFRLVEITSNLRGGDSQLLQINALFRSAGADSSRGLSSP